MRHLVRYISACIFLSLISAQIQYGGEPRSLSLNSLNTIETLYMPSVDFDEYNESVRQDDSKKYFNFGYEFNLSINYFDYADEHKLNNGDIIYRMAISSEDAYALSIQFDQFYIADGSDMFIYSLNSGDVLGAFDSRNNKVYGSFATSLISGDELIIEFFQAYDSEESILSIDKVIHDYVGVFSYINRDREDCNTNVACIQGAPYEDQINSTVMINMGSGLCSASIVNNTAQDLTPYILTADHCISGAPENYTFYFNYQSSSCAGTSGPQNQTMSGATLKASGTGPDFALLELSTQIPESYNPFYSGWSRASSSTQIVSPVGVHHPGAGIKKISFTNDNVSSSSNGNYWEFRYDDGRVIPGSSGSPMFDQYKRQVGIASYIYTNYCDPSPDCYCSQSYDHGYGRFDKSWDYGSSSSSRLRDWLDPANTGEAYIDGISSGSIPELAYDADTFDYTLSSGDSAGGSITLINAGEDESTLSYSASVQSYSTLGSSLDNFGYGWTTSAINNDVAYDWVELSASATQVTFSDNDSSTPDIDIGFDFPFYGDLYSSLTINPNGWLGFGSGGDQWDNQSIPTSSIGAAIFAFWDDLNPTNSSCNEYCGGDVYYESRDDHFIVWFDNVAHWWTNFNNCNYTFQVIINKTGEVELNYQDVNDDSNASIGIQGSGNVGQEIQYNSSYINSSSSVLLNTPPSWVTIDGGSIVQGSLETGSATSIYVEADASYLDYGSYLAYIGVQTNTSTDPVFPVTVNVENSMPGDVTGDGLVNILDVVQMTTIVLGQSGYEQIADLNNDGLVNVLDIISLVNIILEG